MEGIIITMLVMKDSYLLVISQNQDVRILISDYDL